MVADTPDVSVPFRLRSSDRGRTEQRQHPERETTHIVVKSDVGAEQPLDNSHYGHHQKGHRKQQHHPPTQPLAARRSQRTVPGPMPVDVESDKDQEQQRKDDMRQLPDVPDFGSAGMFEQVESDTGPAQSDQRGEQDPIGPEIQFTFIHFYLMNIRFSNPAGA